MQVILLERVDNLGQIGDVVDVKVGYARNFLLPREKALRATKENVLFFENQKKIIEAENLKKKTEAEKVAKKMEGLMVILIRSASEAGHLYGSVTSRDIANVVAEEGFKVDRTQVKLDRTYKTLGLYPINIHLHPEVVVEVTINIARSAEEAKLQEAKGGALIVKSEAEEEATIAAEAAAAKELKAKTAKPTEATEEVAEEPVAEAKEA